MKELQKIDADKTELHALKQIEKKTIWIGSEVLRPGHRCFQINNETRECVEAEYEREVHFNEADKRKIVIKPNCSYVNALNKENALKVYDKGGRQETKPFLKLGEFERV